MQLIFSSIDHEGLYAALKTMHNILMQVIHCYAPWLKRDATKLGHTRKLNF